MFTSFYHLRRRPFENTPDPAFLFLSKQHREVLYALIYGVESAKGFILLAGDVGTGKTTLVRALVRELDPRHRVVAIANPRAPFSEIVAHLWRALDLPADEAPASLAGLDRLAARLADLHREGRRVVLLIDEAHLLPDETLEGIRLLSNLEEETSKLLQIVLVGQNEIYPLLERDSQRSFRQRIVVNRELKPLSRKEAEGYIGHRLSEAGADRGLFDRRAMAMIWQASGGTPRLINQLCDNALVTGYALEARQIGPRIVREVLADMGRLRTRPRRWFTPLPPLLWPRWSVAVGLALLCLGLGVAGINSQDGRGPSPGGGGVAQATVASAPPSLAEAARPVVAPAPLPVAAATPPPPVAPAVPAPSVSPPEEVEPVPPTAIVPPPAATEPMPGEVVRIPPNFSLSSLATQRYGAVSETVLDLIQTANAGLMDIDRLYAGQVVRFPAITRESMVVQGDDGRFHIHYASFYTRDNARRVQERFRQEGRESFFTASRQGTREVFRVFVGSFAEREEAVKALRGIDFKNLPFLNQGAA